MTQRTIVVVDDDLAILNVMHDLLTDEGYQAVLWHEQQQAFEMIRELQPDVAILDLRIGGKEGGSQILAQLRLDPSTAHMPVILCSGDAPALRKIRALCSDNGVYTLDKPFHITMLFALIEQILESTAQPGAPVTALQTR
jgi:CheY-like chemotaxis protein